MALHVSTSRSEQLHFKHYLLCRYMHIKYGTQEMTHSEALMEKLWKKLVVIGFLVFELLFHSLFFL